MLQRKPRWVVLGLLGFALAGCGQAPPAPPAPATTPTVQTAPPTKLIPTPDAVSSAKPTPAAEAKGATPIPEAVFLDDDVVGVVVVHPKRLHESAIYRMFRDTGMLQEFEDQVGAYQIKPESIERAVLVIDKSFADTAASAAGLDVPGSERPVETPSSAVVNHLKQLGLAFHNYHDIYGGFPRADGDAGGTKTGLSWRVHLLPLLDQAPLYQEFHLDEPWDSEHNKTLIERMPDVFNSPGVSEAGKTAVHVFIGDEVPFHGDKGLKLADFTDGTSGTILAAMAGPDTAEIWTKPGGLVFDNTQPKKALGDVGKQLKVLMADGSVKTVAMTIDDAEFAKLVELADGNPIDYQQLAGTADNGPVPILILSLASTVDRNVVIDLLVKGAEEEAYEGLTLHKNDNAAVCFVDDKTILWAPPQTVKKMIDTRKAGKPSASDIVGQLHSNADLAIAIDLQSHSSLAAQAAMINPLLGMLQQIKSVAFQANVTGKAGDKLVELVATAVNEQTAGALAQLASGGLNQLQSTLRSVPKPSDPDEARQQELVHAVGHSATIKQVANRIEFRIPVPEDFDKLPEILKPAFEKAAQGAANTRKRNNLKQIALAFYNFHDTHGAFPGAGRAPMKKEGLSWRVHLLPFLDQAPLYNQFAWDEPWDSEKNKVFIDRMPDIFKTDGVTEQGKTSVHVFTGPGAPFADGQSPRIASFEDGTSNTILVVVAGPETAEIWTKPGGLDFDPDDPLKALGNIGDFFNAVLADGSVRAISKMIDSQTLRRLIQSADGEAIGDF